jgi:hypothetical protein
MTAHGRSSAAVTDPSANQLGSAGCAAVADRESLRSWTQVANHGIITTAGILEGFAGAGASTRTLIAAATTATIVGKLSVGGADYPDKPDAENSSLSPPPPEAVAIATSET